MAQKPTKPVRANLWMPMYWGDYLRDTGHLNAQEHGAYLMLIAHYWSNGRPLPDDDNALGKIARVTPPVWKKIRPTLVAFFEIGNATWMHKRIERELIEAGDRKDEAVKKARAAAAARWGKDASGMLGASSGHACGMPNTTQHILESSSENHTGAARGLGVSEALRPRAKEPSMSERMAAIAARNRKAFVGNA